MKNKFEDLKNGVNHQQKLTHLRLITKFLFAQGYDKLRLDVKPFH